MKVANKYFDMLNFKGGIIMLCQNCNKNEATVKYTEIINTTLELKTKRQLSVYVNTWI